MTGLSQPGAPDMAEQRHDQLPTDSVCRTRRCRRLAFGTGLFALAAILAAVYGRRICLWYIQEAAARELRRGAVTAAQSWLLWSAWIAPGDGRTDLLRAACFRRTQEVERYAEALEAARKKGAPSLLLQQEVLLGRIRAGGLQEDDSDQLARLIDAGVPPNEVALAYVCGFLNRDDPQEARKVLDAWAADRPADADVAYVRGLYQDYQGDVFQAELEYRQALAVQPRHEPARAAIAELLERLDRLDDAYWQYAEWADRAPANDQAIAGAGRILRKLGHVEEARDLLNSSAWGGRPPDSVALELAQVELECDHYEEAVEWFETACWEPTEDYQIRNSAATAFALAGNTAVADGLFGQADDSYRQLRMTGDAQVRGELRPNDRQVADELNRLRQAAPAPSDETRLFPSGAGIVLQSNNGLSSAADLYALHCSDCHGVDGKGDGRAARHLFPRPANLRTGRFRLVSTENAAASLQDLETVIRQGMPGTSMRPFDVLTTVQVELLAKEVQRLTRDGVREQVIAELRFDGEEIDEDEVSQVVELASTPGQPVRVPKIGLLSAEAAARGKDAYAELGCGKCHGSDGTGKSESPLYDESGYPIASRDLVNDPLKGGSDPDSIYKRILLGMPGTPHPGCLCVSEGELVDLVQYCRSISREPKRELTNHEQWLRACGLGTREISVQDPTERRYRPLLP